MGSDIWPVAAQERPEVGEPPPCGNKDETPIRVEHAPRLESYELIKPIFTGLPGLTL